MGSCGGSFGCPLKLGAALRSNDFWAHSHEHREYETPAHEERSLSCCGAGKYCMKIQLTVIAMGLPFLDSFSPALAPWAAASGTPTSSALADAAGRVHRACRTRRRAARRRLAGGRLDRTAAGAAAGACLATAAAGAGAGSAAEKERAGGPDRCPLRTLCPIPGGRWPAARGVVVDAQRGAGRRLWACEQALRCAEVSAVLAWLPRARVGELRRLQLAAAQHESLLFVLRPESVAQSASPARLRLALTAARPAHSSWTFASSSDAARR
jgi:protein ImuA